MTQYLLAVYPAGYDADSAGVSEEEMAQTYAAVDAFNAEVREAGAWVFAGGLRPPETATVVRAAGDDVLVTDGPFSDTEAQIGGFWVLTADDLDGALEWARKATVACGAPVEVRPFQDEPGDG